MPEFSSISSRRSDLNGVLMQYFHWFLPADGGHWQRICHQAEELARVGFTALWLPPAWKGAKGAGDRGDGAYDWFDLGEFDQNGSVATKYGTRQDYQRAIAALQAHGLQVYGDVGLSSKQGGDRCESFQAIPYHPDDRLHPIANPQPVQAYTHFSYPRRQGLYSQFEWHWYHFSSIGAGLIAADSEADTSVIYRIDGKQFDEAIALEKGEFSTLRGYHLDFRSPAVQQEVTDWGRWYLSTTGVDGLRLDAINQDAIPFFCHWLDQLQEKSPQPLFVLGDYWHESLSRLQSYLDRLGGRLCLLDVPLHYNLHRASHSNGYYDMRCILNGTLMQQSPVHAVTFVDHPNTQPHCLYASQVADWFKPLAYALILLRRDGYPCVFSADYYGDSPGLGAEEWRCHRNLIDRFLFARRYYAYGAQYDYFDHPDVIGWTRLGTPDHPGAMAIVMSDGWGGRKWMETGKPNAVFYDLTEHIHSPVYSNEHGWGEFPCKGSSVSIWVEHQRLQQTIRRAGSYLWSGMGNELLTRLGMDGEICDR